MTEGYPTWPIIGATAVVAAALSSILANEDQRLLAERHFIQRTSPVWGLLPIAYLFARGNRAYREGGDGMGPAWMHVAVLLVIVGGINAFSAIVAVLRGLADFITGRVGLG